MYCTKYYVRILRETGLWKPEIPPNKLRIIIRHLE
jgi:hypothetical protein